MTTVTAKTIVRVMLYASGRSVRLFVVPHGSNMKPYSVRVLLGKELIELAKEWNGLSPLVAGILAIGAGTNRWVKASELSLAYFKRIAEQDGLRFVTTLSYPDLSRECWSKVGWTNPLYNPQENRE